MYPLESKLVSAIFSASAWGEIQARSQPPPSDGGSQRLPAERKSRTRADSEGVPNKSLVQRLVTQRRVTHPFALALRRTVLGSGEAKAGDAAATRSQALVSALGEVRAVSSLTEARERAREVMLALDSSSVSVKDLSLALAGITHRYLFDHRNGVAPVVPALCRGAAEGLLNPALTDARLGRLCDALRMLWGHDHGPAVAGWIAASLLECMNANQQALTPAQLVVLMQAVDGFEADANRLGDKSDDPAKSWEGRFARALDAMVQCADLGRSAERAFIDPGVVVPGAAPLQAGRFLPIDANMTGWDGFLLRGADCHAFHWGRLLAASFVQGPSKREMATPPPWARGLLRPLMQASAAMRPARVFALVAGLLGARERSPISLRRNLDALVQAMAPGPLEAQTAPGMLAPMLLGHFMGELGLASALDGVPPAWRLAVLAHDRSHGFAFVSGKRPTRALVDAMARLCQVSTGLFPQEIRAAVMGLALAHGDLASDEPEKVVAQFLAAVDFLPDVPDDARAQVRKQVIRGLSLAIAPATDVLQDPDFNDAERLHLLAQAWVMPAWRDFNCVADAVRAITEAGLPGWFERPLLVMATLNGVHDLDTDTFQVVHRALLRTHTAYNEEDLEWARETQRDLRELDGLMDLALGGHRQQPPTKSAAVDDLTGWYHVLETTSGLGYLMGEDRRTLPVSRLQADRPVMLHVQSLVQAARLQVAQAWPRGGTQLQLLLAQLDRLLAGLERGLALGAGGVSSVDRR